MSGSLYTVRTPDGLELGPVRPETIVDLILTKKIMGNESVSADGGDWVPLDTIDEFRRAVDKREGRLGEDEDEPMSAAAQTDLDDLPPPPDETVEIPLEEDTEIEEEIPVEDVAPETVEKSEEIELEPANEEPAIEAGDAGIGPDADEEHIDLGEVEDALQDVHLPTDPPKAPVEVPPPAQASADSDEEHALELESLDAGDDAEILELEPVELAGVQELEVLEVEPERAKPAAADVRAELKNPDNRYTIRNSDGLVLGPVRVATLRDLMQAGAVAVTAEIQKNNEEWKPLAQVPELLYLYDQVREEE